MITGFAIGVASTVCALLLAYLIARFARDGRTVVPRMERASRRLQDAISELMARANEADQESKYISGGMSDELAQRLSKACSDLVLLADAVKVIDTRIARNELDNARKDLLISLGAANKISTEINDIRSEIRRKKLG